MWYYFISYLGTGYIALELFENIRAGIKMKVFFLKYLAESPKNIY